MSEAYKRCAAKNCQAERVRGKVCPGCGGKEFDWTGRVTIRVPGEAPRRKRLGTYPTKADAERALRALLDDADRGTYRDPTNETLGEYLVRWLVGRKSQLRPGAWDACRLHVTAYITPRIGHVVLRRLDRPTVRTLYQGLREDGSARGKGGLSEKTVWNVHRTLYKALEDAVGDGLIVTNPAKGATTQPESPRLDTWSREQLLAFFEAMVDDRMLPAWVLAARTGMRRGELCGLRWRDVDLKARTIVLTEQRAKGGGTVHEHGLKGKRGRRIALDDATVAVLTAHQEAQRFERRRWGDAWKGAAELDRTQHVLAHEDGSPFHPDSLTKMFARRVRDAGLSNADGTALTLHGLRHTHATLGLLAGIHPKVMQERLGHSSIAITLDVYSHATDDMQRDAADRMAQALDGTGAP